MERTAQPGMDLTRDPHLVRLIEELRAAAGPRLLSVVLYGSAARGDYRERASDLNLLLVLDDLGPATLEAIAPAVRRWTRRGQPVPRLFTPALLADSADAFPIEFLDIRAGHRVLHGDDPVAGLAIRRDHLRLQCEREMKEKLMRLREAYLFAHGRPRALRALLAASSGAFTALFRGCLFLMGEARSPGGDEVVRVFCDRAGLDPAPFAEAARLRDTGLPAGALRDLFGRYYAALERAARAVDRFEPGASKEGETR